MYERTLILEQQSLLTFNQNDYVTLITNFDWYDKTNSRLIHNRKDLDSVSK